MFKKTPLLMAIALTITATCTTPPELNLYKHTTVLPTASFKFLLEHNIISIYELFTLLNDGNPQPSEAEIATLTQTIDERVGIKRKEALAQKIAARPIARLKDLGVSLLAGVLLSIPFVATAILVHLADKHGNAAF